MILIIPFLYAQCQLARSQSEINRLKRALSAEAKNTEEAKKYAADLEESLKAVRQELEETQKNAAAQEKSSKERIESLNFYLQSGRNDVSAVTSKLFGKTSRLLAISFLHTLHRI